MRALRLFQLTHLPPATTKPLQLAKLSRYFASVCPTPRDRLGSLNKLSLPLMEGSGVWFHQALTYTQKHLGQRTTQDRSLHASGAGPLFPHIVIKAIFCFLKFTE